MKIPRTWASTVFSLRDRLDPIARLEQPSAMSESTSRSRVVRSVHRIDRTTTAHELRDHLGIDRGATLRHPPNGVAEPLKVGHPILQQVPGAAGAVPEEIHRMLGLDVLGQDEHPDLRMLCADRLRRDQTLGRVCRRHPDVDDGYVGETATRRFADRG